VSPWQVRRHSKANTSLPFVPLYYVTFRTCSPNWFIVSSDKHYFYGSLGSPVIGGGDGGVLWLCPQNTPIYLPCHGNSHRAIFISLRRVAI
jgi:hypothetical protein